MVSLLGKNLSPIGLDIGSSCVKMLQLEPTKAGLYAVAAGYHNFPGNLEANDPQRREFTIQAVRKLLREKNFRGRRVVSALPDSEVVIRTVRLAQLPGDHMEETVRYEAAEKLPFSMDLARLQCLPAGRIHQGNEVRNEVIVLAVQNELINQHIKLLSEMSLEPVAIDIGPTALFRCFERFLLRREDENEVSFIVDIGAANTKVIIGHGAEIAFVKIIEMGTRSILEAVGERMNISAAEASGLWRRTSDGSEGEEDQTSNANGELADEVFDAARPVLSELGKEISLCLRYHGVMFRGYRPKLVRLTGGGANCPRTTEFLSGASALPVEPADPFRHTNTAGIDVQGNRRKPAPIWAVSAGLALRGMVKPSKACGDAA